MIRWFNCARSLTILVALDSWFLVKNGQNEVMAQVPKIYAPTPAQSVAAARGMPVSKVASLDQTVEETNKTNIASFEEEFVLREESAPDTRHQNHPQRNLPHHSGRLIISSQFFTSLMDYMHTANANDVDPTQNTRRIESSITKAIRTYETNAKVIYRKLEVTGTQLSVRL